MGVSEMSLRLNIPMLWPMLWLCLSCGCAAVQADDDKDDQALDRPAPSSAEILLAAPPAGWAQVGGSRSESLQLAEYVPEAELKSNPEAEQGTWKEKITMERLAGAPVPDPLDFLEGLRADHLASCTHGSYAPISAAEENGYPTAVALLACPKLSLIELSQVTLIKVIQGNAALYTITRSIRGAPQTLADAKDNSAPALDAVLVGGASVWLRAISVCEAGSAEHPCPETPAGH
jgi:hypothetical protein